MWKGVGAALLSVMLLFLTLQSSYASPEFSDQVVPFDRISRNLWKFIPERFPELQRAYGYRMLPDGDAVLLNKSGREVYRLQIRSEVNAERTSRISEFVLKDALGRVVFGLRVKNLGTELAPIPVTRLRQGDFPFYPAQNVRVCDIAVTVMDSNELRVRVAASNGIDGVADSGAIEAWFFLGYTDRPVFRYREWKTSESRHFMYEILEPFGEAKRGRLEARKIQTGEMVVGTEEFLYDGRAIGMGEFEAELAQTVLFLTDVTKRDFDSFLRFYVLKLQ